MTALTEKDPEEGELIPVETPIEEPKVEAGAGGEDDDDDDDDDSGDDARLAASEDDSDDEVTSAHRRRRAQRRDGRKRARERTERELAMVREQNAELLRRLTAVESHAVGTSEQSLQAQLEAAANEVRMAENIIARATEAGNGDDVVAAMRLRDTAQVKVQQLFGSFQQVQQARQQPQVDPRVATHAKEWIDANPWYNPAGTDRDSALTKSIDAALVKEGYNPATRVYWEELTARVSEAFGEGADGPAAAKDSGKRKGPPTGNTREHAPASTRKEIYVTPERKQAMIEAGVWDDPVRRQRLLKSYQDYDRQSVR